MGLETFINEAKRRGASDLHLEPGLPAAVRIRGQIEWLAEAISPSLLRTMARSLLTDDQWMEFLERRSFDLSRNLSGVRCRINVLTSSRGIGLAVRLLAPFQPTIESFNLHPCLRELVQLRHGLVVVTGPTGSGKSSTLAALIHEINVRENRHIVTIEAPVEYAFKPRKALIRQREVGRDTPSFERALLDALREDPDVLVVGEMREPETVRLTLNAAETGQLVLTTLHSANCAEAVQRIVGIFPDEIRSAVGSQLADCLQVVVAQRLCHHEMARCRVAECEILKSTTAVRQLIRRGEFFKISQAIDAGAPHGMWSFARYREWLDSRTDWRDPESASLEPPDSDPVLARGEESEPRNLEGEPSELPPPPPLARRPAPRTVATREPAPGERDDVIVIQPPDQSLKDIISELEED
ncbi:MAG: PilT/PilU family type 4a pilus ATPase [Planctomycetota bacterium]